VTEPKHEVQPDVPFGTQPRRSMGPLAVLILLFAVWFVCLVWLALRYPAR
jgi:hypothetical protein